MDKNRLIKFWEDPKFKNNIFIACDFFSLKEFYHFISQFSFKPKLKIGYLLFYRSGIEFIENLIENGYEIFLDLKLCDIENTILNVANLLKDLKIKWITIHPWVGFEAIKHLKENLPDCKVIIVPFLTTISYAEYQKLWLQKELSLKDFSKYLIEYYQKYCDGVVCSLKESYDIKNQIKQIITICPGGKSSSVDDKNLFLHAREEDIFKANKNKLADYLVVGRKLITSKDPLKTYKIIYEEFNK